MWPLHALNAIRTPYIGRMTTRLLRRPETSMPLQGLSVLDVGCGGGILSESLEALGGRVTGIDASEMSITVARDHARRHQSKNSYLNTPIQSVPDSSFDIVVCMEVVEHVESLEIFMEETCRKVKKDGLLFLATINRTLYSLLAQKIGAEYVLNWLPRGTHDWRRFVKPVELRDLVKKNDFESRNVQGVGANIFKRALHLSDAVSGNYMMACKRV